jgi:Ca2+:H+ antiporter
MSEEADTVLPMVTPSAAEAKTVLKPIKILWSFAAYFIGGINPYLNFLLVFCVITPIVYGLDVSTNLIFISGIISIAILADRIRFILQQMDDIVPGWINSTLDTLFNNSPEFCFAFYSLYRNQVGLTKFFLLGQVTANLSLVLGVSFLVGGFYRDVNKFRTKVMNASSMVLFVGLTPFLFGTIQGVSHDLTTDMSNHLARGSSFILIASYIMYLIFQNITHNDYFTGKLVAAKGGTVAPERLIPPARGENADETQNTVTEAAGVLAASSEEDGSDTSQKQEMEIIGAMVMLVASLVLLAVACDAVTYSVQDFATSFNISYALMGGVLIPIATNFVEYITAMFFVAQNKSDLCINSAYDGSVAVLVFLYPVVQLYSWYSGDDITYEIGSFGASGLALTISVCTIGLSGGNANWVVGGGILGAYIAVAAGYVVNT